MAIDNDRIDPRAINTGDELNEYEITENLCMGIAAAKSLGM